MAGEIQAAFDSVYADGPTSEPSEPSKPRIRSELAPVIQAQVDLAKSISEGAAAGYVVGTTWSALAAINGTRAGQPGRVPNSDAGTHTDPVVGGTVPNAGEYAWSVSPAGWRRVGDVIDPISLQNSIDDKADQAEVDALSADVTTTQGSLKDKNPRIEGFSAEWEYSVAHSDNNRVLLGKRFDDIAPYLGQSVQTPAVIGFSSEWFSAVYDPSTSEVVEGLRWDGSRYPDNAANPNLIVYEQGAAPDREVLAFYVDADYPIAVADGDNTGPAASDLEVRWISTVNGITSMRKELLSTTSIVTQARIVHIPIHGQSNSVGSVRSSTINGTAPAPGKALMFSTGIRVFGARHTGTFENTFLNRLGLDPFADAAEALVAGGSPAGETGWARMAASLTEPGAVYENDAVLVSAHGIDGRAIALLDKGTVPYNNLLAGVQKAYIVSRLLGKDYLVPAVVWVQGEGDASTGTSGAAYKAALVQLQADLDADIKAITGQADDVVLMIDQLSAWTAVAGGGATSPIPQAQLDAALENPTKIVCVGPKYSLTYSDGLHYDAESTADWGERVARAVVAGTSWKPLYPASASRVGAVVTASFDVPEGSLSLDTTLVSNPGNYGIEFEQTGGNSVTISSVAVASASTLEITLSDTPTGTDQKVKFGVTGTASSPAGPTTGPRTNIRDSAALVSEQGNPLYNWCCHSTVAIS